METVDEEKDLGVMIRKDLTASSPCINVAKTANQVLGMIKRMFIYKTKLQLFKSVIRSHRTLYGALI